LEFVTIKKLKIQNRNKLLFSITFFLVIFIIGINFATQTNGSYSWILLEDDYEHFVVEDLVSGNTYDFSVTYNPIFDEMDVGFSIFLNRNFKNAEVTSDDLGTGFEYANYTAPSDGDFYIGVWMNSGDTGQITITVTEQGTLEDMDVKHSSPTFASEYTWVIIMVSVAGGFSILFIFLIIFVGVRAFNKQKARVIAARASGESLPRSGRKKDKCPFCGVKLPPESLVTCPYCAAPITE